MSIILDFFDDEAQLPVRLEGWRKVGSQLLLAFLGGVRAPGGEAACQVKYLTYEDLSLSDI